MGMNLKVTRQHSRKKLQFFFELPPRIRLVTWLCQSDPTLIYTMDREQKVDRSGKTEKMHSIDRKCTHLMLCSYQRDSL